MNRMKNLIWLFLALSMPVCITSCGDDDEPNSTPEATVDNTPTVNLEAGDMTENSISFVLRAEKADSVKYVYTEKDSVAPTVAEVAQKGIKIENIAKHTVTIDNLDESTEYVVTAVAWGKDNKNAIATLNMKTLEKPAVKLSSASGTRYSGKNYALVLTDSVSGKVLNLDMYCEDTESHYLPSGVYTVGASDGNYIGNGISYTNVTVGKEKTALKDGTVTVDANAETKKYTIDVNVLLADSTEYKAHYEGEIEGIKIFTEWEINPAACSRLDIDADRALPGEFYLKLNDSDWTFEMVLQFIGSETDKELAAGTYEVATTNAAGTLGAKSGIDMYSQPVSGGKFVSGKAVVTKSGSEYTITIDCKAEDGMRYIGTYKGEIENITKK